MQNVPEYMQNVPESMQNVPECMQNVPGCSRMFLNACRSMNLHVLEYSGTFCMHSRTFWNILHICMHAFFQFWLFWPKLLRFKFAFKFATLVEIWVKCEPVGR